MRGPSAAFLLVASELLIGTFLLMWVTMLFWRDISRGHYRATTWVLAPLTAAIALLLPADVRMPALTTAGLMAVFLAAVYSQRPLMEWAAGAAAVGSGLWALGLVGMEACVGSCFVGAFHALAGGMFLGAVTHGMILGHWYLNQPRLPLEPLKGAAGIYFLALIAAGTSGLVNRSFLIEGSIDAGLLAFSTEAYWWTWLVLMLGTAVLGLMIRATVASRSTQSATGLLYLAMVPALGSQFLLDLLLAT